MKISEVDVVTTFIATVVIAVVVIMGFVFYQDTVRSNCIYRGECTKENQFLRDAYLREQEEQKVKHEEYQKRRKVFFDDCLKNVPTGPNKTTYNDWAEVVDQCDDISQSQAR